ncbi:MAG: HEPN domain-containing protein [Planctomycetota bacterium]
MKNEDKLGPWFEDADEDMRAYEACLQAGIDRAAAYHLEQAMQKYLKGALDEIGKFSKGDRTHNIPDLINKLKTELLEARLADFTELGRRLYEIYPFRYFDTRPSEVGLSADVLKQWAGEVRRLKAIIIEAIEKCQEQ